MSDEAQQPTDEMRLKDDEIAQMAQSAKPTPVEPRRTAMQVAEAAREIAQTAWTETDNAVGMLDVLSEKVTDLSQRMEDTATRDQVDGRLHEALEHPESGLVPILRTEVASIQEEMGGYIGGMNRAMDTLRQDLDAVQRELSGLADPISGALAEDAAQGQAQELVSRLVRQELDGLLARLEQVERRAPAEAGMPGEVWAEIAQRVENQAKVSVREALATAVLPTAPGARPGVAGVHAKVLDVMNRVGAISKDRQMSEGRQRYTYRGIDDTMDAVGHAMREVGLVYTTEIVDREVSRDQAQNREGRTLLWTSVMLTVRYTFIDPVDGSTQTFEMAGEGRASDDKATSKAAAMALKYGLLHALMIPVSDMPDPDAEAPQVVQEQPTPQSNDRQADTAQGARRPQAGEGGPEMSPTDRARRAVAALRALDRHPPGERHAKLEAISEQIRRERLYDIQVDGGHGMAPLGDYVEATRRTLTPQQAGAF